MQFINKQILFNLFLFSTLVLSSSLSASEGKKEMPTTVSGVETITSDQLATMLIENDDLIVIDARIKKGRSKGFIESSTHLADVDTNCDTLAKVIPNKQRAVVFYCTSSKCGRSLNSVSIALKCDYKKIYWFRDGFNVWKSSGYPFKK